MTLVNAAKANAAKAAAARTAARPSALGGYEDWPAYLRSSGRFLAPSHDAQALADVLGVPAVQSPPEVAIEWETTHDGVVTSQLHWQLGFGPRTTAWFVRPDGAEGPLP